MRARGGREGARRPATDREAARRGLPRIAVDYQPLSAGVGMDKARAPEGARVYRGLCLWRRPPNASEGPLVPAFWRGNVRGPVSVLSQRGRTARRLVAQARERGDRMLIEGRWRTDGQIHTS